MVWWRRSGRVVAVAIGWVVLTVLVLAGCSATSLRHGSRVPSTVGCSTRVAWARRLGSPAVHTVSVGGSPTAAVMARDGRWAFASLTTPEGAAIEVLRRRRGRLVAARTVPLRSVSANGMQLTHDGRFLIVADGSDATAVLRVSALETGRGQPMAGLLDDSSTGQFEVAVSGDDRYVFVSDETSGTVSVFDLARALHAGFSAPGVAVRTIHLAYGAVGLALSPNGALLYVTTFGGYGPHGLLWVIDTARAERGKAPGVVLGKVSAGCQPVRVQVAPDGREVWVTALQSNALLAYSADAPREHRVLALQAVIPVGSEPVGLALIDDGRLALVANSNRGVVAGSTGADRHQSVSVIDTEAALAHRPALIGNIPAGSFPRDLSVNPETRTVLLANFNSNTIEEFHEPPPS